MKVKDYQAMKKRIPGAWDDTALALAVAKEIDRAVRKENRRMRDLFDRSIGLAQLAAATERAEKQKNERRS